MLTEAQGGKALADCIDPSAGSQNIDVEDRSQFLLTARSPIAEGQAAYLLDRSA